MKTLQVIVQIIGVVFIILNIAILFTGITPPANSDKAFLAGWYIGKSILFVLGFSMLMVVRIMKKRMVRKEANTLIDSLPG